MPKEIKVKVKHDEDGLSIHPTDPKGFKAIVDARCGLTDNHLEVEEIRDDQEKLIECRVKVPDHVEDHDLDAAMDELKEHRDVKDCNRQPTAEQWLLVFPSGAQAASGDWIAFNGVLNSPTIPWMTVDGVQVQPAGPLFTAQKSLPFFTDEIIIWDVLSSHTPAQVADAFLAAFLIGGTYSNLTLEAALVDKFSVVNNGNGTITLTALTTGALPDPIVYNAAESGPGSIKFTIVTQGA